MYNTVDDTTPTSNRPLRGGKATVYEGGVRVPCVVTWPGLTKAGSRTDSIIQSQDFYPTFVQLLGLKPQPGQIFDGVSVADALAGKPFNHPPIFTYFPHSPGVPDRLPPTVTITDGDWKLMRLFYDGENGAHGYRLYNLKDDIGERNDLTAAQPARVKQMDALIEKFLADARAVTPKPNPAYDPQAKSAPSEGKRKPAKQVATGTARQSLEAESDAGM
jgi:arylsulfatase A-like enzyme